MDGHQTRRSPNTLLVSFARKMALIHSIQDLILPPGARKPEELLNPR